MGKQADIDEGVEPGVTSVEAKRIRELLEQENRELRRANDLLKRASAFFAAELDRPSR
jgi:transposase